MVSLDDVSKDVQLLNTKNYSIVYKYGFGVRHVQAAIFFLTFVISFATRTHMGVTIVAMTSNYKTNITNFNETSSNIQLNNSSSLNDNNSNDKTDFKDECNKTNNVTLHNANNTNGGKYQYIFDWPKSTQEMVLGSFNLGFSIMMLPMGVVSQRWGGKIPLQIALFVNGIISIITPSLTFWGGWKAICFCRILQGLAQVGTVPSIHTLLAKWVPDRERAKITSYVYAGVQVGNLIAFQLGGILGASRFGWPVTFWIIGVSNLIMFGLLTVFLSATPMEHSNIRMEEKQYILETTNTGKIQKQKVPWRAIITSKHVWGIFATHIGNGISYIFFLAQVPSYIHYILDINVRNSALLSSLPIMGTIVLSVCFGWLSDYATNNKIVSKKNARRISNSISQLGITFALICVSFTNNMAITVLCFFIAMSFEAASHTGWVVNYIDLAPNFSGLLLAMGSTLMNICDILSPVLVSLVITDLTNIWQWRIIFFTLAGLCLVNNAIFLILISVDTQPWNYSRNDTYTNGQKLEEIAAKKNKNEEYDDTTNEQTIQLMKSNNADVGGVEFHTNGQTLEEIAAKRNKREDCDEITDEQTKHLMESNNEDIPDLGLNHRLP